MLRVAVEAYVPEGGDFLDEGWGPVYITFHNLALVSSPLAVKEAISRHLWATEVTRWRPASITFRGHIAPQACRCYGEGCPNG